MESSRIENLVEKLNKAKQVMDITTTKEFDEYAKQISNSNNVDDIPSYSINENNTNISNKTISGNSYKFSKLPKEIIESIKENPLNIEESSNNAIDELAKRASSKMKIGESENIQSKNTKFSEFMANRSPSIAQTLPQIDYSLLKLIINDAIKENLSEMKKNMINESSGGSNVKCLKIGNSIQFLDSDGNLYEAKLVFKKNIKKNK